MEAYGKGDYESALAYFNAAYIANPQREDIKEYINQCNIKINSKKAKDDLLDKESTTSIKSNKQIKEEMKDIYNSGLAQFSQENYYEALKSFELLRSMSSKYKFYDYREQTNLYIAKSRNAIANDLYKQEANLNCVKNLRRHIRNIKKL